MNPSVFAAVVQCLWKACPTYDAVFDKIVDGDICTIRGGGDETLEQSLIEGSAVTKVVVLPSQRAVVFDPSLIS